MSTQDSFTNIPVIDFDPFLKGSIEDKKQVASEIDKACREVGFFYLKNHGVPQELLDRVLIQSKLFFGMPENEKMKIKKKDTSFVTGYNPKFNEKVSRLGDLKETFDFVKELPAGDPYLQMKGAEVYTGNMWPESLPGFQETIYDNYLQSMVDLADKVMEAYALALNLSIDWFKPMTRKPICLGRLAHYFAPTQELPQDQLSCGVHTDQLGVTLLAQLDGVTGLQIKNDRGDFVDAVPIPGTLVVNIGDLIERWSNGHYKATEHRVVVRPGVERYSAIIFHMPDYHATIDCCVKDEKPKYPPVIAGDFLLKREETYYGSSEKWIDHNENLLNADKYFTENAKSPK